MVFLESQKKLHNEVLDLFSLFIVGLSYTKEFDKGIFEDLLEDLHTFVIEHDYEYKKAMFLLLRESVRLQVVTLDQVYSLLKESKSIDGAWKYYILTQFESDENKDASEELLETIFLLPCLENKDIFLSMYMINSSLHSSDSLFIKKYINVLLEILALKDMTIYEWNVMMKSFYSMEESWQEYRSNLAEMYEVFLQFQPDFS